MDGFDFLLAAGATPGMCPEYLVSPALPPAMSAPAGGRPHPPRPPNPQRGPDPKRALPGRLYPGRAVHHRHPPCAAARPGLPGLADRDGRSQPSPLRSLQAASTATIARLHNWQRRWTRRSWMPNASRNEPAAHTPRPVVDLRCFGNRFHSKQARNHLSIWAHRSAQLRSVRTEAPDVRLLQRHVRRPFPSGSCHQTLRPSVSVAAGKRACL